MNRRKFLKNFLSLVVSAPVATAQLTARSLLTDPEKQKHLKTAQEMFSVNKGDVLTAQSWQNAGRAIEYLLKIDG